MASVNRRTFRSIPYRSSIDTWTEIVNCIAVNGSSNQVELESVSGIVSSTITDKACKDSPIKITCDGPQTRIYCVFDDDALEDSDVNEDALGYDPLKGDWLISIPCLSIDLEWVQSALQSKSERIIARDSSESIVSNESKSRIDFDLVVNKERFLNS